MSINQLRPPDKGNFWELYTVSCHSVKTLQYHHLSVLASQVNRSFECLLNSSFGPCIKVRITGPLWRESTSDRCTPFTKAKKCGKRLQIMTLSCKLILKFGCPWRGWNKSWTSFREDCESPLMFAIASRVHKVLNDDRKKIIIICILMRLVWNW